MTGRRPVSPFSGHASHRGAAQLVALAACAALAVTAVMTVYRAERSGPAPTGRTSAAAVPAARATLAAAQAPAAHAVLHVPPAGVQYSCVGRELPGDIERHNTTPAVIDRNRLTAWHCDGDGARLRPRQSLTVFFAHAVTLTEVGVIGYDPLRPCRFVIRMELVIGATGYGIRLPAGRYPALRWFAVPALRTGQLRLVVMRTAVLRGSQGRSCARTAIAQVGFASKA